MNPAWNIFWLGLVCCTCPPTFGADAGGLANLDSGFNMVDAGLDSGTVTDAGSGNDGGRDGGLGNDAGMKDAGELDAGPEDAGYLCVPRTTGFITDRLERAEPALPTLPDAGGKYIDPVFGTTILRLTDDSDGTDCSVAYSYWPTFNRDSTRGHVGCSSGPILFRFNPRTMTVSEKQPLFDLTPSRTWPGQEDAIWSSRSADVLHVRESARLWAWDVAERRYTLLKDFSTLLPDEYLWQMSRSDDDTVFAFSRRSNATEAYLGYIVWKRDTDTVLVLRNATQLDEVQLDKTGRWLLVKTGSQGAGAIEVKVENLLDGTITELTDDGPDFAPGHSDNGHGFTVGTDNWNNRLTIRQLSAPRQFSPILDLGTDWTQDLHISMLAGDERWAALSLYQIGAHSSGVFRNEILQVALDGSQQVRRLAHHRSAVGGYQDSPRANISRDGCFIAFTSRFGGRRNDVFVVSLSQ